MRVAEAASTTWFGAYWLHTGHSPLETGVLCAVPVAAEFLAMWKGGPWMRRHSAAAVMLVCCAASAVRWMGTPYCESLWCAVPLQSIHAFTFGFFYPASLVWLKHSFGDEFFHTRYLTESAARAATAAVTFVAAGWAIAAIGYIAIYATCLVLTLVSGLWWLRDVNTPHATKPT
jgi:MFS family permease